MAMVIYIVSRKPPACAGELVTIAKRVHPFPSRTRKLSFSALTILWGQPHGKIRSCRLTRPLRWFFDKSRSMKEQASLLLHASAFSSTRVHLTLAQVCRFPLQCCRSQLRRAVSWLMECYECRYCAHRGVSEPLLLRQALLM